MELLPSTFEAGSTVGVDVTITLDNPETGMRNRFTLHSESIFSANPDEAKKNANENVMVYANVLNAMEKAEEAIQSMDVDRFKEARGLFDRFYKVAHQYAIDHRDQQLLNQTFLLRHFMADLSVASERALMHDHDDARKQLQKDSDYRRYLQEHHQPPNAP